MPPACQDVTVFPHRLHLRACTCVCVCEEERGGGGGGGGGGELVS